MQIKFERRVVEVDLYGSALRIFYPTTRQLEEYLKELESLKKSKSGKSETDIIKEFLEKLGLSSENFQSMEVNHLTQLVDILLDAKKN